MEPISTIDDAKKAAAELGFSWEEFCGYVMEDIRGEFATDTQEDCDGGVYGFVSWFDGIELDDVAALSVDVFDADPAHKVVEAFWEAGSNAIVERARKVVANCIENQ